MNHPSQNPHLLVSRLELILNWYQGMVSPRTGRWVYTFEPESGRLLEEGSPVRAIASVWDAELLGTFLNRSDLALVVQRSLEHFSSYLVARNGALILDPIRLGEPSTIAHSAFMLLALADSALPDRSTQEGLLANGLLQQQRENGSFRIYYGGEPDEGLEFYPGEAMLALMRAYARSRDPRYLDSVERGFAHYHHRLSAQAIEPELRVFCSNWQSQYALPLWVATRSDSLRQAVSTYVFSLQDAVVESGFYEELLRHPRRQATVEVASALEGLNDAYALAVLARDDDHRLAYAQCIQIALAWLLRAQCLEGCAARERGGFGHGMTDRTQRIDVTGHVASGFIKTARNELIHLAERSLTQTEAPPLP